MSRRVFTLSLTVLIMAVLGIGPAQAARMECCRQMQAEQGAPCNKHTAQKNKVECCVNMTCLKCSPQNSHPQSDLSVAVAALQSLPVILRDTTRITYLPHTFERPPKSSA